MEELIYSNKIKKIESLRRAYSSSAPSGNTH